MVDLSQLLHEVCHLQREIAPWARIQDPLRQGPVRIAGDRNLLFQVFSNLLANAIKYSPRGGDIEVTLQADTAEVVVAVTDHGIGIPAADCERIFERYTRASNSAGIVGTGVGLYFARTAVQLRGGEIAVHSREGVGSRFTVKLPVQTPVRAARAPSLAGHA